jgi:hypothetical protein
MILSQTLVCWLRRRGVVLELAIECRLPNTEQTCGGELISSGFPLSEQHGATLDFLQGDEFVAIGRMRDR